jgi:hypothetical protein
MKRQQLLTLAAVSINFILATSLQSENEEKATRAESNPKPEVATETNETLEAAAWDSAVKTGTATSYGEFYKKYPKSSRIKTKTGTVRGRFWFSLDQKEQGVFVTVEGMKVLLKLSVEEALKLKAIASRPSKPGSKIKGKGKTFNFTFGELVDGESVYEDTVVAAKDSVNCVVVLSADGKQFLTWDARKAKVAKKHDTHLTFISGVVPPSEPAAGVSKQYTPESQDFNLSIEIPLHKPNTK